MVQPVHHSSGGHSSSTREKTESRAANLGGKPRADSLRWWFQLLPPPTSLCQRKWRRGPSGWLLASLGPASLLPPPVALISTEGLPAPLRLGSTAARRAGLWDSLWIRVHSSEGPRAPRSLLSSQAQPLLEQPYVRPTLPSVPTRVHRLPGPQSEDGETSTGLAGFMFPGGHTLYPGGQLDKPGARILRLGWL